MLKNSDVLKYKLPLFVILVGASVLRVIGVRWGLPMAFHNDEPVLVLASQQFFTGDFNPHNFLYPSLQMYLIHVVHRLYALVSGTPPNLYMLYLLSRLVSVAFGIGVVYFTFFIGKVAFNRFIGLGAALLISLTPAHVGNSHFAVTDIPLTFFLLVTAYFTIALAEKGRAVDYVLTGLFWGLSVSTKIPGAVFILPITVAHLYFVKKRHKLNYKSLMVHELLSIRHQLGNLFIALLLGSCVFAAFFMFEHIAEAILSVLRIELWQRYYGEIIQHAKNSSLKYGLIVFIITWFILTLRPILFYRVKRLIYLIVIAVGVFFVTTPYSLLDYKTFARDFLFQAVISQTSWSGKFYGAGPAYLTHLKGLTNQFGLFLMIMALIGIVRLLTSRRISQFLLLCSALTYYSYIGTWKIIFGRYMIPVMPFLVLFAVVGISTIAQQISSLFRSKIKYVNCVVACFVAASLLFPSVKLGIASIQYDRYLLKKNTRTVAYEWAIENLPRDAKILREQYAPELELAGFDVHNVNFTFNDSVNVNYVARNNIDYIIVTDKLWKRPVLDNGVLKRREAYDHIQDYADLIYHLKPSKPHPGPEIKIYKTRMTPHTAK